MKRVFDIFCSFIGIVILLPVLIIIALLIKFKMTDGPILFRQKRIGKHGKAFTMIKFRTMKINHNGSTVSVKGENRITNLGAKLRAYKLDELPELWNVLIGDMSFVGPRPDVPGFADNLKGNEKLILKLRPGITGPASIKYSNEEVLLANQENPEQYNSEIIWPDKVRINLGYLKHQTIWLDLKIIIYTILRKKLDEEWAQ